MADIADVVDALYGIVVAAILPSGVGAPGLTGNTISVGEGWPEAADLDAAFKVSNSIVSLYADPGFSDPGQLLDRWNVVTPPAHGMTATLSADGASVALSGVPLAGEFVTAITLGGKAYSFANPGQGTATTMAAGLAALIAQDWPGTTSNGAAIAATAPVLTIRIGARGTLTRTLRRQKAIVRISVWAPNPADRTTIARAIDVALAETLRISMNDGTQALNRYAGTLANMDDRQRFGEYRRDLLCSVQYNTTTNYAATEVTAAGLSFSTRGARFTAPPLPRQSAPPAPVTQGVIASQFDGFGAIVYSATLAQLLTANTPWQLMFPLTGTGAASIVNALHALVAGNIYWDGALLRPPTLNSVFDVKVVLSVTPLVSGGYIDVGIGPTNTPPFANEATADFNVGSGSTQQFTFTFPILAQAAFNAGGFIMVSSSVPAQITGARLGIYPRST